MIGSFTALVIVLGFVLPGYMIRVMIGRRIYLRSMRDFELLFQSVLLSTFLLVWWTLVTTIPWLHPLSPLYIISQMNRTPPSIGYNALISLAILLGVSALTGRWSWLVERVVTHGRRLRPYPIWYNLFGATPLTTEATPWGWIEMDEGKAVTGRVIDFGLDDLDAGSLVLVMVTVIGGVEDDKRPGEERWYIPEKSIRGLRVKYVTSRHEVPASRLPEKTQAGT